MRLRDPKTTDHDNVEKALNLLLELIRSHQKEIEPALWTSAMICALADNYEKSGVPYEFFKQEMEECMSHYAYGKD